MDLYGQYDKCFPQKITVTFDEALMLALSYWILFLHGADYLHNMIGIHNASNSSGRRAIIFAFNIVIFLRIAFTMFYLMKRKIPWGEGVSVSIALAVYYVGFSLRVLPCIKAPDWIYYLGILVFILGCVFNTSGELQRDIWKRKPENTGKIYTQGFFKYSMHVNYFG